MKLQGGEWNNPNRHAGVGSIGYDYTSAGAVFTRTVSVCGSVFGLWRWIRRAFFEERRHRLQKLSMRCFQLPFHISNEKDGAIHCRFFGDLDLAPVHLPCSPLVRYGHARRGGFGIHAVFDGRKAHGIFCRCSYASEVQAIDYVPYRLVRVVLGAVDHERVKADERLRIV